MKTSYTAINNNDDESSSISSAFNDSSESNLFSDISSSSRSRDGSCCTPISITENMDPSALKVHPSYTTDSPLVMLKRLSPDSCSLDSRKRGIISRYLNDEVSVCDYAYSVTDSISNASASETIPNSYRQLLSEKSDNCIYHFVHEECCEFTESWIGELTMDDIHEGVSFFCDALSWDDRHYKAHSNLEQW